MRLRLDLHQAKTAAKLDNTPMEPKFQLEDSQTLRSLELLAIAKRKKKSLHSSQ